MEETVIGIILFVVIFLFLFILVIGGVIALIPLAMFLTKKLVKSKRLRQFASELREEAEKEGDGIDGYVTISDIKKITGAQNARIEAIVMQNKEIVEKLDRLIEQVGKWSGAGYD